MVYSEVTRPARVGQKDGLVILQPLGERNLNPRGYHVGRIASPRDHNSPGGFGFRWPGEDDVISRTDLYSSSRPRATRTNPAARRPDLRPHLDQEIHRIHPASELPASLPDRLMGHCTGPLTGYRIRLMRFRACRSTTVSRLRWTTWRRKERSDATSSKNIDYSYASVFTVAPVQT